MPNSRLEPDYVLVPSYALKNKDALPDAEVKALKAAVGFALLFPEVKILMASSNYFWPGCVTQENNLKVSILRSLGIPKQRIILLGGVANTIEEIKKVRFFLQGGNCGILCIADQMHARSVWTMFAKIFPQAQVAIHSVEGDWDDANSPLVWGKSNWRWLAANIVRHVGYRLLGERIANFHHPIRKK